METQTTTRKALSEIYPKVCSGWQTKIDKLLSENKFNDEIPVSKGLISQAYSEADTTQKKWLEVNLPKPKSIADQIKGYESACELMDIKPKTLKDFEEFYGKESAKKEFAGYKIKMGIKAINKGWYPDFNDDSQRKYYIWKYNKNNVFEFEVGYRCFVSSIGSDFYISSDEKARIIHSVFEEEVKEYYF